MNSDPLSESTPRIGNGIARAMSSRAASTHLRALLRTLRFSVQPVAMSVTVSVKACSPVGLPPSWPTRSISTNPGTASSQSAQVRTGIWLLSSEPGLVWQRPLSSCFLRSGARRRSMVAADMPASSAAVSSSMSSSPNRRRTATSSARHGASRLPAGMPSTAQQKTSAAMTFGPYFGGRGRLGLTTAGRSAWLSALRAWLRCHPVVAHNSSRIRPLPDLSARA